MDAKDLQKNYSEAWKFQNEYARSENNKLKMPKGVFRFKTFEEFNEWKKKVIQEFDLKKK
jgi:hypothetical protein